MTGLRSIVPLSADSLRGITPATITGEIPVVELVDPRDIFVEEAYQRVLGENGTRLIRRIYAEFDWTKFKPPVCVRVKDLDNALVCIDGQHTATAAASHPSISKIPVMIVSSVNAQTRARGFVGHNRDRLGLTQMAIYYAELAADDPVAMKVDKACKAAGAEILRRNVNLKNKLPPGQTIAVGTIKAIAATRGSNFLARVLKVLVDAGRGPMKADEIGVVTFVLESSPLADPGDRLAKVVGSRSAEAWAASVAVELAEKGGSLPHALARIWSQEIGLTLAAGLALPGRGQRTVGSLGSTARMMARKPAVAALKKPGPIKVAPVPEIAPAALQKPSTPPQFTPKPPAAPEALAIEGANQSKMVRFNGIEIDLLTREVRHRGGAVRLRDDGIRLLAGLARIMPALLEENRAARMSFGELNPESRGRLRLLVDDINPALARAKLEVKFVPKEFICLRDLSA